MQTQKTVPTAFLILLLAMLCGCQPEVTTPQAGSVSSATAAIQQPASGKVAEMPAMSREEIMEFARDTGCFACHAMEKKLLGPAWKHVAGLYRDDPEGEAKLMNKIAKGGSGVWGSIDMPAYPGLSEAQLKMLSRFILSLE